MENQDFCHLTYLYFSEFFIKEEEAVIPLTGLAHVRDVFRGSFRAPKFLTRMLSLICRRVSFWVWAKKNLCGPFETIFQMFISMRVRNWWTHWAYESGTGACTEHVCQELVRTLSIRVRNWCLHWACVSGNKFVFKPKVTYPERLYGVKILKIRAIENLTSLEGHKHKLILLTVSSNLERQIWLSDSFYFSRKWMRQADI